MTRELPSPSQILEELADKAALQIDQSAPVAFDAAIAELTRYHRFLLNVNAALGSNGKPFNYATVAGEAWRAPHNEWVGQYRGLYERAANRIGDNPDFIEKLAHVPLRLLPGRDDPEMSEEVLRGIVDLGIIQIHQIEAWVSRRTVANNRSGMPAGPRVSLTGSDAKSYENLLPNIVGAWESLLQSAPHIYHWRDDAHGSENERWNSLRNSWPFLWRHLSNTAYMLAVSVWNEDEAGAALFRDALVRWPQTVSYQFADRAYVLDRRLAFPNLLSYDLSTARDHIRSSLSYVPFPTPDELFNVTIHASHDDVVLLTGALLLQWSIDHKQTTDLGARTASKLLHRKLEDSDNERGTQTQEVSFASLIMDIIRLEIAPNEDLANYGGDLDYLVANLDNMTERRVVPGRVFTPSTLHDRNGLQVALAAILLTKAPGDNDALIKRIRNLAKNDTALPQGDRSLREIVRGLGRLTQILESSRPAVLRGAMLLTPKLNAEETAAQAKSIVSAMLEVIEAERTRKLKEKPIDPDAIDRLREAAERSMAKPPADVPFFKGFPIVRTSETTDVPVFTFRVNQFSKAQFVFPPMEPASSGFAEHYVQLVTRQAGNRAWGLFTQQPRQIVSIPYRIEEKQFWEHATALARDVGAEPVLIVSQRAQARALRRLIRLADSPFKIERKIASASGGSYIATIESIDVYAADFEPGKAWLFSPYYLQSLKYHTMDDGGHILTIAFESGEDLQGPLVAQFRQQPVWADWAIYEILCEDPLGEEI